MNNKEKKDGKREETKLSNIKKEKNKPPEKPKPPQLAKVREFGEKSSEKTIIKKDK